jgi:uncharacterized protein (DUF2062 family)
MPWWSGEVLAIAAVLSVAVGFAIGRFWAALPAIGAWILRA